MQLITSARPRFHRRLLTGLLAGTAAATLAACGSPATQTQAAAGPPNPSTTPGMGSMPGMGGATASGQTGMPGGMPGMGDMPMGNGRAATVAGLHFAPAATSLPPGRATSLRFRILDDADRPVTHYQLDQTKPMHFYLVRVDLTGFQHVHPTMTADGTWTAPLAAAAPGTYRAYTNFIPSQGGAAAGMLMVLGRRLTVPGHPVTHPLPAPTRTTTVDGYTLTASGELKAGRETPFTLTITQAGRPVTTLQPYLQTYAHLTAIHQGDLAFAHLHPQGTATAAGGGPTLTFDAMLAEPGNYRIWVQFQTNNTLHTAAITLTAS